MYTQVSNTPGPCLSGTAAPSPVVATDPVLGTEQLVGLTPHAVVIDPRRLPVPLDQFLGGQTPTAGQRTDFGDLHAVAG